MTDEVSRLARNLVRKVDRVDRRVRGLENKNDLGFSSIEDGRSINEYTTDGTLQSSFGGQFDGTHGAVVFNGPKPPTPTMPAVEGGAGIVSVAWDGYFVGARPLDLDYVRSRVADNSEMLNATSVGVFVAASKLVAKMAAGDYWVQLVAESKPGRLSDPTTPVKVTVALPVDVAAIEAELAAADQRLVDARTALEAAQQELSDALAASDVDQTALATTVDTLKNTTIPALDAELSAAEGRLVTAETNIDSAFTSIGEVPGQIDAAKVEAVDIAAITAQQKADAAEAAAVAAASTDATNKFNTAQTRLDALKSQATSLVYDGGFELGASVHGGNGVTRVIAFDKAAAHTGGAFAKVLRTANDIYPGFNLPVSLTEGRLYEVSFWVSAPVTAPGPVGYYSRVSMKKADGTNYWPAVSGNVPNDGVWRKVTYDVPAFHVDGLENSLDKLNIWLQGPGVDNGVDAWLHYDDVTMVDVTDIRAAEKAVADAKAEAISAAALDATAKADAAEAAAVTAATTAAAADATAKAEAAEARAAATAALDAQAKADAAEAAALAAANTYADAQASGAGSDALEAAKLDATAKADAAEAAAISAAALDATAKKEQAEATAAADAKAKADAALAAAKADATAKADAAAAAAAAEIGRLRASGANLVVDPSIESTDDSVWAGRRSTESARTGASSLKVTANGTGVQDVAMTANLTLTPGRVYYVEAWVRTPATTWSGDVNIASTLRTTVGGYRYPAPTGGQQHLAANTGQEWTKLWGYLTIPEDVVSGVPRLSVRNTVTAGTVFYWDDFLVLDVTESQAAIAAAAADATAKADAAQAAALATALASATRYLNRGTSADGMLIISGVGPKVAPSPTAMGGEALLKTGAGHGWYEDLRSIQAIDPNVLYRVTARVRVVKPSTSGSTHALYFGAVGYADADATVRVNAVGGDSPSSQQWTTQNVFPSQTGEWVDYVGYYKGFSTGNGGGAGTLAQPRTFQAATKYFGLGIIMDYNNGNGDWELSHMAVEAIDAVGQQALADAASARARAEAVKTEAAADATAKAKAAETGAVAQMAYKPNATFSNWTGTHPAGFGNWQGTPIKETGFTRYPPFAVRFNLPLSTDQGGMYVNGLGGSPNLEYWTIEVDLYLVSGSLGGSGVILDWSGMTGGIRSWVNFLDEIPGAATGKWYRVTRVVRRPTTATGTLSAMTGYLMAQWTGHTGAAAKEIVFDRFDLRPSTAEEITAYKAPADASAKADAAKQAAITAAAADATSKAEAAEAAAAATAAADATAKADAAEAAALAAANTYAEAQASGAGSEALEAAKLDATTKADAAKQAAIDAAALDATAKAEQAEADAATDAAAKANQAKLDAIAAAKTETTNQITTVNNSILGRSFYGTAAPTVDAPVAKVGETYRRKNSLGHIFEEYVRTDTGWTVQKISGTTITALDVGQLSAGSASILDAVVQKIAASTAAIQKADIGNLTVTGTSALNDVVAQKIAADSGKYVELDVGQLRASTAVIPDAVITRLFSDVVKARMVTSEAFIGENALLTDSVTAPKIVASSELWAKLGNFVTVTSDMIVTGALDGKLITGAVIRTAPSGARVQFDLNGMFAYNAAGEETIRLNGTSNLLSGEIHTGGVNKPGIIILPTTSTGKPGIWFSSDGSLAGSMASIYIDADWNMRLRGNIPEGSTTRRSVIIEGSLVSDAIGSFTRNTWNISQDGWGFFDRVIAGPGGSRFSGYLTVAAGMQTNDFYLVNPPESTFGANVGIANSPKDRFYKLTSKRANKYAIDDFPESEAYRVLDINPRTWFDRHQTEAYADWIENGGDLDQIAPLRRIPGLVAEEVRDAGLDTYVTYDADGAIEGVAYDRLPTLFIPILRDILARLAAVEGR